MPHLSRIGIAQIQCYYGDCCQLYEVGISLTASLHLPAYWTMLGKRGLVVPSICTPSLSKLGRICYWGLYTSWACLPGRGVVYYGSARLKDDSPHWIRSWELGRDVASLLGVTTWSGGGPGMMQASTLGAHALIFWLLPFACCNHHG